MKPEDLPRKLGANRNETAARPRKHDKNFKQSRDVREDRGERQAKLGNAVRSVITRTEAGGQPRKPR
jgi:hypothetical protein